MSSQVFQTYLEGHCGIRKFAEMPFHAVQTTIFVSLQKILYIGFVHLLGLCISIFSE